MDDECIDEFSFQLIKVGDWSFLQAVELCSREILQCDKKILIHNCILPSIEKHNGFVVLNVLIGILFSCEGGQWKHLELLGQRIIYDLLNEGVSSSSLCLLSWNQLLLL